jgi:4-alpha-glucanotransferase
MTDDAVYNLARRAGVAVDWRDYANQPHRVSLDTLRHVLSALGLPCQTADDLAHSSRNLDERALPPLVTATLGQPVHLSTVGNPPPRLRIAYEGGGVAEVTVRQMARGIALPPIERAGYHQVDVRSERLTVAVAPARCMTVSDVAPRERIWGMAAQIYGLRSPGDCGIGDMAGVVALAKAAARLKADALALSPTHALFAALPNHYSPYSPSSRLFNNPLHADAAAIFGELKVAKARAGAADGKINTHEELPLIDWQRSSRIKMAVFRRLFDDFFANEISVEPATALAKDFVRFCATHDHALSRHAIFETIHAARLQMDQNDWNWQDWPAEWRDPHSQSVQQFAEKNKREILFHSFLQWLADRSAAATHQKIIDAGMRIGLIADLAVGMNSSGSATWGEQKDVLIGLQIGAPPDLYNDRGQNWGLTSFSPSALRSRGFAPFIATLRACMRHAGGVRIDHAMGLMRLWVVPQGAEANEGAYLAYPLDDLLRLTALESYRNRSVVIGEDLGTVPTGFRERLAATGIYGMNVLWFERDQAGFTMPQNWPTEGAAMTSTHDLPTVAGWWRGRDIEVRGQLGFVADQKREQTARDDDRRTLWAAFREASVAGGTPPPSDQAARVDDAAFKFIARTPSRLTLLPLEDVLALEDQPNLPGTTVEQPNWRRRYSGEAGQLLEHSGVRQRLQPLTGRRDP